MISLQNMKYLITIANQHSISAAARDLYISQSALSTAVREVETQLGITLFERSNRGVRMTLDGEDFIHRAREIVEQSEYLENRYRQNGSIPMRFSVSTQRLPFATLSFTTLINSLDLKNYDVALRECPTHEVIHDVASRRSEIGVLCMNHEYLDSMMRLFNENSLTFTQLGLLRVYVFVHRGHPLSEHEVLTLQDLRPYPFVTFDQGNDTMRHFSEELQMNEPWDKNIHVIDRCSKIALVRKTEAFSIGPDLTNSDADKMHARENVVRAIPLEDKNQMLQAGVLTRSEYQISKTAEQYIQLLTQQLKILEK